MKLVLQHIRFREITGSTYSTNGILVATLRHAELKPDIPLDWFPKTKNDRHSIETKMTVAANAPKKRSNEDAKTVSTHRETDEFGDSDLDDGDLIAAGENRKLFVA